MRVLPVLLALLAALPLSAQAERSRPAPAAGMARIPAGSYLPLYAPGGRPVRVRAFALDRLPVTRGDFLAFVRGNPRWQKGAVRPVFAERGYLAGWAGPLAAGSGDDLRRPVTDVSWFAAKAYCEWRGKRLPTLDEWEYAAAASETRRDACRDPAFLARLLALETRRGPLPVAGTAFRNVYGVHDLHGGAREWVRDAGALLVSSDSRGGTAEAGKDVFCAAGSLGTTDPGNYPAFLRHAFRAGLTGRTTAPTLGFRCASSL